MRKRNVMISRQLPITIGLLSIVLFCAACVGPAAAPRPTAELVPTATLTPIDPAPTVTVEPTLLVPPPSVTPEATPFEPEPTPSVQDLAATVAPLVNLIANGRFQDANGNPSFAGWQQEPAYWCNVMTNGESCGLHRPMPQSPSQTWWLQADREFRRFDLWPAECCPEARAWTDIANVPTHSRLFFGWEEIHHLYQGALQLRVYGINENGELVEIFLQDGPRSPVIESKDVPIPVFLVEVPIPDGGYHAYRVEVYARLADTRDGILIGDLKLMILP